MRASSRSGRSAGLTLVEMLVVLTLLAVVAGIAVTATEGHVEQSRFDATRRTLENVDAAVLGTPGLKQPDGTLLVTGFVADVGRLPEFVDATDAGRRIEELWVRPAGMPGCGPQKPTSTDGTTVLDADVVLTAGWRGPYLRLPVGADSLADGSARALRLLAADDSEITAAGSPIEIVSSLGADGLAGGAGYDLDVETVFRRTAPPAQPARHLGSVSGTITRVGGAGTNVILRAFGPVDGVVHDLVDPITLTFASGDTATFSVADLPVGSRALRAYQTNDAAPARDAAFASAPPNRSRVHYLTVPAGGVSGIALTIE